MLPIDWPAVEFEKWQALGNDYVILEAAALPFELTPAGSEPSALPTPGSSPTGCCCYQIRMQPGCVARLRIFNPDGSEAEVSGNGAREAILYMRRRGWADSDEFSIETAAGCCGPGSPRTPTCTVEMGEARLESRDYPVRRTRRRR